MQNTSRGFSFPIGTRFYGGATTGVNFSVYSSNSTGMDLLLFSSPDDPAPVILPFSPKTNRTYHYWHMFVAGLKPGQLYAFRAEGPNVPEQGLRFDPQKALLDPYGRGVVFPPGYDRGAAARPGENYATALKSVIADPSQYNWEGDHPLHRSFARTVIYEMHVAGFTRSPSSAVTTGKAGTYAGLVEKIPYLKDLGITAVELLPVQTFDPYDAPSGKTNYWGYSPIGFIAPHPFYASTYDPSANPLAPLNEFRDMVKALHKAGIEVILDVVYNHTAEGNQDGPTLSFRGLANREYYILEGDKRYYANYTGTGNTLNANEPIVRRMILDSLRYWVAEMHVDGFRFDLASILSRDEEGVPLVNPPSLLDIETDPVLAGTKLIAEAWDAGGLYQVGSFIGDRWQEWNGHFRDDLRAWVRCDVDSIRSLPNRLLGSPDIYEHENREAEQSINFVTCHDGFTLNDMVSYNVKHNEANGENNRDGSDNNLSWNYGVEGPSDDPQIEELRERQIKNLLAYTLLSIGTPMLLMGDEVRRTQQGNNNAYAQDNELSWFDWQLVDAHPDLLRFAKELVRFRLGYTADPGDDGLTLAEELRLMQITWHGLRLNQPDWGENSHSLAVTLAEEGHRPLHMIFNAYWEALDFELPPGTPWKRIIDTCLPSPEDIVPVKKAKKVDGDHYNAGPRSVVVLIA
jgi:isoamylase